MSLEWWFTLASVVFFVTLALSLFLWELLRGFGAGIVSFVAMLPFAIKGLTSGLVDVTPFFDVEQEAFTPVGPVKPTFLVPPSEQFEAWTSCPSCGRYECHRLREPNPYLVDEWGPSGELIRHQYDVIRICECGREFGQK